MLIGYARISKTKDDRDEQDQNLTQINSLKSQGAEIVFQEVARGSKYNRPELHKMLSNLNKDDVVIVWKLDRLSRSLKDTLNILELIEKRGAKFRSITENIDTTTSSGILLMQILGSIAQFERSIIGERTKEGLKTARAEGRIGGRPRRIPESVREDIRIMVSNGSTQKEAAKKYGVCTSMVCRLLRPENNENLRII